MGVERGLDLDKGPPLIAGKKPHVALAKSWAKKEGREGKKRTISGALESVKAHK